MNRVRRRYIFTLATHQQQEISIGDGREFVRSTHDLWESGLLGAGRRFIDVRTVVTNALSNSVAGGEKATCP